MSIYTHILLAVDFHSDGEQVISRAEAMARQHQAQLSLVHVLEFTALDMEGELALPQELLLAQEWQQQAERRMDELGKRLRVASDKRYLRQGSTRGEILHLAAEVQVDLIILGSHGRQGIQRLLGSTANAVLHGAQCDVLAVRIQ